MANQLLIAPRAESDMTSAFSWYEKRCPGLGFEFIRCIEAKLSIVVRSPQLFRKRGTIHRMAITTRFPYGIYFIWDEDQSKVVVRRVLHFAQEPQNHLK